VAPDIQVMAKTRRSPGEAAPAPQKHEREHGPGRGGARSKEEDEAQLGIGGALQGAARYGLLNIPEPVAAADTDFDRGISRDEFRTAAADRFQLLDSGRTGRLILSQLEAQRSTMLAAGKHSKRDEKAADTRLGSPLPKSD
jgi:hypothetical protein